ncbi:MAG: Gar1/Naf1 family protein [Methanomassiliicoccales archaeon]|nr:Gar1/Naf1 family protein [Methanomassiliicoccales archaeon]
MNSHRRIRLLGAVQEIAFDGKFVVRATFAPNIGMSVLDNRKRVIGRVKRVFGPVNNPFVSIEPANNYRPTDVVGKQIYVEEVDEHAKAKRRNG